MSDGPIRQGTEDDLSEYAPVAAFVDVVEANLIRVTEPVILGPNITGSFFGAVTGGSGYTTSGVFTATNNGPRSYGLNAGSLQQSANIIEINASRSSSIYGNSTTVQPNSLVLNYVIKY